ncbi:hypothetical protein QJQ45_002510 [Haematococcus lacustris]|nr:hypothetical protein QJQ45_002510 [Haematococcus lacustris]
MSSPSAAKAIQRVQWHLQELDLEGRKPEWDQLCHSIQHPPSSSSWEERAKTAEYELVRLLSTLVAVPDPLPYLTSTSAMSAKLQGLEAENQELRAAAQAAAADAQEVEELVERHRELQAAHRELQERLQQQQEASAASTQTARALAEAEERAAALAAELAGLQQASSKALRAEHERVQSALFELSAQQEQEAGSRQRELEASAEELEQAQQQLAELQLERDQLSLRLAHALTSQLQLQPQPPPACLGMAGAGWDSSSTPAPREVAGKLAGSWTADLDSGQDGSGAGAQQGRGSGAGAGAAGGAAARTAGGLGRPDGRGGVAADEFWERQLWLSGRQLAEVQGQLEAERRAGQDAAMAYEAKAQAAAHQLASAQLSAAQLQAELQQRPGQREHAELLARLEALQQLVDGQMEVEGWSVEGRQDALRSLGQSPGQVTSVLQERVRKLTSQLASLQRELQETRDALAGRSAQLAAAQAAEAQQAGLVRQLEEDLAACKVPCCTAAGPDSALAPCEHTLSPGLDHPPDPMSPRGGAGAPAAARLGGPEGCGGQGGGEGALLPCSPSGPRVQDVGGLLDIVVHQRDRFRQRMAQLEEEKSTLADSLQRTQRQVEEARADSVALYEKIRYLERFTQQQAAGARGAGATSKLTVLKVDAAGIALNDQVLPGMARGVAKPSAHRYQCGPLAFEIGGGPPGGPEEQQQGQAGPGGGGGQVRARGGRPGRGPPAAFCFPADPEAAPADPETRAAKAYEAKVNPFNDFQKGEVESRVRSMQLHDRAVLAGSRLLLASRLGRAFAAVYALLLHLFIMVLLYYAMLPRTRIEMVDIGALQQQQQAGAAATPGRMLRLL